MSLRIKPAVARPSGLLFIEPKHFDAFALKHLQSVRKTVRPGLSTPQMWRWSLEAPGVIFIDPDSKSDEEALMYATSREDDALRASVADPKQGDMRGG
jgi:hypothetical protein